MKKFLLNLLVFIISSVAGIVFLEVAVRAILPWYDPARQICFYQNSDGVPIGKPNDVIRQRTPKGDFDLFSRFNKYGFRDGKDLATSREGDIFVLGDSFSFGWGIQDGQRYSDRLEKLLGKPVYNIAIPTDLEGYEKLLKYARSHGAWISRLIVGLCMENDLRDYSVIKVKPEPVREHFRWGGWDWRGFFKTHSAVYLAFSYELQKIPVLKRFLEKKGLARDIEGLVHKNVLDEQVLRSSRDEILKMVHSVNSAVVLVIPSRMLWAGAHHAVELAVHERMIDLLKSAGVEVVDMRPYLEKGGKPLDYYFKTDPHWNKEGHALAAQALAEYLKVRKAP